MHQAGIGSEKEDIIEAIRYFERLDYNKAEEFAEKALERNPYGNKEKVMMAVICVSKSTEADPSILAEFVDPNDQLLIKPKDEREEEFWLRPAEKIMDKCNTRNRKLIVVNLWAIYYLQKIFRPDIMNRFEKVYITHHTISVALQEINQVNDDDIRRCLMNFQNAGNVIIQSPSMKDQLEIRSSNFTYQEVHQALLLSLRIT